MAKRKKDKLSLHVYHNIFLSREQRYALVKGEGVSIVGVSVPVWFYHGNTSEPAVELFCRYLLTNNSGPETIVPSEEGYCINMPQIPTDYKPSDKPTDEEWRKMTPFKQEQWYRKHPVPDSSNNLRDIGDGGSEYLRFEQQQKVKLNGKDIVLSHSVEVQDINELLDTLN